MRRSKYRFIPILVPTLREGAPIRQVQGKLMPNNFATKKYPLYDVCLISDMPLSANTKYALSTIMKIVDVYSKTDPSYMAIMASSLSVLDVPVIELSFIGRLINDYNAGKVIDEVQIDIVDRICKISRIRYKDTGWLRTYSNSKLAEIDLKIFPKHKLNNIKNEPRRIRTRSKKKTS